jgi:hypothetical protein
MGRQLQARGLWLHPAIRHALTGMAIDVCSRIAVWSCPPSRNLMLRGDTAMTLETRGIGTSARIGEARIHTM